VQGGSGNSGPGIGTAALAWGVGMLSGYELGQMTDGGDHGSGGSGGSGGGYGGHNGDGGGGRSGGGGGGDGV
jgi:hypothetical protein